MTQIAKEHDCIIVGSIEAGQVTYESEYGLKLAWDAKKEEYVFISPKGLITIG